MRHCGTAQSNILPPSSAMPSADGFASSNNSGTLARFPVNLCQRKPYKISCLFISPATSQGAPPKNTAVLVFGKVLLTHRHTFGRLLCLTSSLHHLHPQFAGRPPLSSSQMNHVGLLTTHDMNPARFHYERMIAGFSHD